MMIFTSGNQMKLSIIIPVYNEERQVAEVIRKVNETEFPGTISSRELIIVDDCSTDNTVAILKKLITAAGFRLILMEKKRGI